MQAAAAGDRGMPNVRGRPPGWVLVADHVLHVHLRKTERPLVIRLRLLSPLP